jgi:hypothetical protein
MDSRNRFTDAEWGALAIAPSAAAGAMIATSRPGFFGTAKEVYASVSAIKAIPTDGEAAALIADLAAYASEHDEIADDLKRKDDDLEAARTQALDAIDRAGLAAAKLEPGELEGFVSWVIGVARAVAEAAADKGETAPVSDAEEQTIAEIERRLRRGR